MSEPGDHDESGRASRSDDRSRRRALLRRAAGNIPGAQVFGRRPEAPPQAAPAPDPQAATEAPRPPPGGRVSAAELAALRAELTRRAAEIEAQDHYQRLGVPESASDDKIKAAWLALAKRFHPDRAAGQGLDETTRDQLTQVFAALQEAWQALGDPDRRRAYDGSLVALRAEAGREAQRRRDQAVLAFRKGEVLLRKRDFAGALTQMQAAWEVDPEKPEWTVGYAWALHAAHPDGSRDDRAKALLAPIARGTSFAGRANYYLGLLARMDDDLEAAERYFRAALDRNPELTAVHTELRALELRREREGRRGLFRRSRKD